MWRKLGFCTGLSLAAGLTLAGAQGSTGFYVDGSRLSDVSWGLFCATDIEAGIAAPNVPNGNIDELIEAELLSATQIVPGELGVRFGVRTTTHDGLRINTTFRTKHPPMGPGGITDQGWFSYTLGSEPSWRGWEFEEDYEIVFGEWVLSAEADGKELYSITFVVVPPDQYPGPIPRCGHPLLSS